MDPFFQTAVPSAPDPGQPAASPAASTEQSVDGGVDLAAQFTSAFLPQYGGLIKTAEPVTLLAIHAGFVLGHYLQGLFHKK